MLPGFWATLCRSLQLMGTTAIGDGVGKALIELCPLVRTNLSLGELSSSVCLETDEG